MTLIYAERRDDMIYFLADTFWERPLTGEQRSWSLNPLVKLISLRSGVLVAYAGNSDQAERAIEQSINAPQPDLLELLIASHLESRLHGNEVEFLVAFQDDLTLVQIKNGAAATVTNSFLGSAANFNRFQSVRHSGCGSDFDQTMISVVDLPEGCSPESCNRYSSAMHAFQATISEPVDEECGGICVPYILTRARGSFMHYLGVWRGAIQEQELSLDGSGSVPFNDPFNGQCILAFGGHASGFFAHFVEGGFAFVHRGFSEDRLSARIIRGVDPYDVADELTRRGMPAGFSTWRSAERDASKIRNLINSRQSERAAKLITESATSLAKRLSSTDQLQNVSFDEGFLQPLREFVSIECSLDDLNHLGFLIQARFVVLQQGGDGAVAANAQKEWNSWREMSSALRFRISMNKFPE